MLKPNTEAAGEK